MDYGANSLIDSNQNGGVPSSSSSSNGFATANGIRPLANTNSGTSCPTEGPNGYQPQSTDNSGYQRLPVSNGFSPASSSAPNDSSKTGSCPNGNGYKDGVVSSGKRVRQEDNEDNRVINHPLLDESVAPEVRFHKPLEVLGSVMEDSPVVEVSLVANDIIYGSENSIVSLLDLSDDYHDRREDRGIPAEYRERKEELKRWVDVNGPPQKASRPGFVGLKNQGATCYLNSLLQGFFCLPEFRNAIAEWRFDASKHGSEEMCIPYQLQLLFAHMNDSRRNAVSTKGFTKSCGFTQSDVFQQHDIQELCRILFDALERSDKKLFATLQTLFEVNTVEFLRSTKTPHEWRSERQAKNLDISVPLEDRDETLEAALARLVVTEEMTGENRWFCEEAGTKIDAERGVRYEQFPRVLSIHLMRFVYDRLTYRRKKLTNDVDIPLRLDLSEFNSEAGVYNLAAVCFHTGSGYGGHYYAWTKGPADDDEWIICNDEHKAPLDAITAGEMEETGRLKGDLTAPYFLLYRKSLPIPPLIENPHEVTLRKENIEFDDMHRLYAIHLDVKTVRILTMEDHRQRLKARVARWLRQNQLSSLIEPLADIDLFISPNGKEYEARSSQLLKDFGDNLYFYDQQSCTAEKEVTDYNTARDCRSPLLFCPNRDPPEGDTVLLLWKDGKFDFDNFRQCTCKDIGDSTKEMCSEPFELLVIQSASYMSASNTPKVEVLGPWRRRVEFLILDVTIAPPPSTSSSSDSEHTAHGSNVSNTDDNATKSDVERSCVANGLLQLQISENLTAGQNKDGTNPTAVQNEEGTNPTAVQDEDVKKPSRSIGFREAFDNCVNGLTIEHSRLDELTCNETVVARKQWKVSELKAEICKKYALDPAEHHLKMNVKIQMIKDESQTLDQQNFSNGTPVYLCSGVTIKEGYFYIDISLVEEGNVLPTPIGSVVVIDKIRVEDFREKVFDLFMAKNARGPRGVLITQSQIRLRADVQKGTVVRDGNLLRSQVHLFDGKVMFAQILDEEEDLDGRSVAPLRVVDVEHESTTTRGVKDFIVRQNTTWANLADAVYVHVKDHVDGMEDLELTVLPNCPSQFSFRELDTHDWRDHESMFNLSLPVMIRDSTCVLARSRARYQEWKEASKERRNSNSSAAKKWDWDPTPLTNGLGNYSTPARSSAREKALVICVAVPDCLSSD
eukprot:GEMP01004173.1.p1 GENE.GEMP01004173.1~~GEMP01004173.1.p1  ORF type:complete len:1183 (+),score=250.05 GEMP01004173.1:69-3617(+)